MKILLLPPRACVPPSLFVLFLLMLSTTVLPGNGYAYLPPPCRGHLSMSSSLSKSRALSSGCATRVEVLKGGGAAVSLMWGVAAAAAAVTTTVASPAPAFAGTAASAAARLEGVADDVTSKMIPLVSNSNTFRVEYPETWTLAPKPLQTHEEEVRVTLKPPYQLWRLSYLISSHFPLLFFYPSTRQQSRAPSSKASQRVSR